MYEIKKWNHNNLPIIILFFLFDGGSISWWFAPYPTPWRHLSLPPFSFSKFWKNNCLQKEINISKFLNMFHFSCQTSQHYQRKSSCLEQKKTTLCLPWPVGLAVKSIFILLYFPFTTCSINKLTCKTDLESSEKKN